ncbi:MAG: nicotinate-nucleotide adenylyltransferase [Bacteroidales bacterium]|nr:nicotinate-nucleotide adenylyltransferase [Bacteroidales bacterium]
MKTGLFFGSFNPVHIGHMVLANYFIEFTPLEELWFVISPHNPLKKKESLLADHFRLEMVELAIGNDYRFRICDIEFNMPRPSYTIDTLAYLSEKHPKNEFVLIMGSDSLAAFHKWKNFEQIIARYHRYIYPRQTDAAVDYKAHKNITLLEGAPMLEVSSSFIRSAISGKKDVRHFLPGPVYEYIEKYNLYR